MKEKRNILGSLFGRDRETTRRDSEIYVTHEKIPKSEEKKTPENIRRTQMLPACNTPEDDEYYKNLVKEVTKPDVDKISSKDAKKETPVTEYKKKTVTNAWSDERFKNKRSYTTVPMIPAIKPLLSKKLTILLVEETSEMIPYASLMLGKNLSVVNENDFLCIIRYSENADAVIKIKNKFNEVELKANDDTENDKKCFYDALEKAYEIVEKYCLGTFEDTDNRYKIESTEIIGIGTASDNSSKIDLEETIKKFDKILQKGIKTKYFCIDDIYMKNAAILGFRFIGSINFKF